jgi:hypothetical protein
MCSFAVSQLRVADTFVIGVRVLRARCYYQHTMHRMWDI